MGFDASKPKISTLDYDFRPYVQASGITPEPTDQMVYDFQYKIRDVASLLGNEELDPNDQEEVAAFMNNLTREDMEKVNQKIFEAVAELTQGRPSYEQIAELSSKAYRLGQAYFGSLVGDIMDPKNLNSGTNQ